ncbi:hypothetical protein HLA87_03185 [Mycoplasma miroungigenitalium]|uniref:Uncharacterized protein n=1 Tax=Mycoplasma miroungigenitalium TaxID=754515 RepID=A0A6M4JBL2_9MOLU|nr:hypothetical protein [Mycoplasma miroungigenitalium]QJR43765.1 hypothetical protein HLA87_03185 [Mycoplasma miroungigenitalium]
MELFDELRNIDSYTIDVKNINKENKNIFFTISIKNKTNINDTFAKNILLTLTQFLRRDRN